MLILCGINRLVAGVVTYQAHWSVRCCGSDGCQRWRPLLRWGWSASFCLRCSPCPAPCLIGCRRCAPACRSPRLRWSSSSCFGPWMIESAGWRRSTRCMCDAWWTREWGVLPSLMHTIPLFWQIKANPRMWRVNFHQKIPIFVHTSLFQNKFLYRRHANLCTSHILHYDRNFKGWC